MKKYSEYKDSGIEWIGQIPSHWKLNKLKREFEFSVGGTPASGNTEYYTSNEDEGYKWVNISDLNNKVISNTKSYVTLEGIKNTSMELVTKDSLLFSFKLSVGKVGFIDEDMYTNEAIASFSPESNKHNLRYFYYASPIYIIENANENIYGAKILNQDLIKNAFIVLPPIEEQDKIANYLDKKTSQIEELISKKEELIETLKASRTKLISEAVTKGLDKDVLMKDSGVEWIGEIPSHWECKVFKRIIKDIKDGTHGTHPRVDEGEYLLSAKNLNNNYIEINESDSRIPYKDYKQIVSNGFPKKRDILLSTVGSIGRSCVYEMEKPMAFQRSVTFIRLKNNNNPYFYRYFIESEVYQNQLNSYAKTSAQSGIYMGDILKTTVLSIPLDEQNNIVNYLNEQLERIDKIVQIIEEQIELLKKAKQNLITEVVTGKIDVTNL